MSHENQSLRWGAEKDLGFMVMQGRDVSCPHRLSRAELKKKKRTDHSRWKQRWRAMENMVKDRSRNQEEGKWAEVSSLLLWCHFPTRPLQGHSLALWTHRDQHLCLCLPNSSDSTPSLPLRRQLTPHAQCDSFHVSTLYVIKYITSNSSCSVQTQQLQENKKTTAEHWCQLLDPERIMQEVIITSCRFSLRSLM